jgi:hypothetical protein
MAWTQRRATVRLVELGWAGNPTRVMQPWQPFEIRNDACAWSAERWQVQAEFDSEPVTYPWWAVITEDDNARTRFAKFQHARKIRAAKERLTAAERELRDLTT